MDPSLNRRLWRDVKYKVKTTIARIKREQGDEEPGRVDMYFLRRDVNNSFRGVNLC